LAGVGLSELGRVGASEGNGVHVESFTPVAGE
jgi:hypothetical protein